MPDPSRTPLAVVTGAGGAIGRQVSLLLTARGFHVVAVDRDSDALTGLAAHAAPSGSMTPLALDLTREGVEDAVATAVEDHGGELDLLVHNAGIVAPGPIEGRAATVSRREQAINLSAPILLTERLFGALRAVGGLVVAVGSAGAFYPMAASPGYSASKAGLRAYLLAVAGSTGTTGVRVALVHPAAVDTPMLLREAQEGGSLANFVSEPLAPEVVARAVVGNLDRVRLETILPRSSTWQMKAAMLWPGLLTRLQPLLDRLGRRGLERYCAARGIPVPEWARRDVPGSQVDRAARIKARS